MWTPSRCLSSARGAAVYRTVHRFAKNSIGKKVTDYNVRDALVEPLVAQMVSATLYFQRTMWVHFLRCPTMCPHTGSFRCSKQGGLLATSWYAAHRLRRQASTNKSAMEHRHSRDCFERWHSLSSGRAFGLSDRCTRPTKRRYAGSFQKAPSLPPSLGEWSNTFRAYRAAVTAMSWSGNESARRKHCLDQCCTVTNLVDILPKT